ESRGDVKLMEKKTKALLKLLSE
ncbi:hypothetical protein, partial [Escherichia coli]|nr:phosphomannomutase [Escherichia coli]